MDSRSMGDFHRRDPSITRAAYFSLSLTLLLINSKLRSCLLPKTSVILLLNLSQTSSFSSDSDVMQLYGYCPFVMLVISDCTSRCRGLFTIESVTISWSDSQNNFYQLVGFVKMIDLLYIPSAHGKERDIPRRSINYVWKPHATSKKISWPTRQCV